MTKRYLKLDLNMSYIEIVFFGHNILNFNLYIDETLQRMIGIPEYIISNESTQGVIISFLGIDPFEHVQLKR